RDIIFLKSGFLRERLFRRILRWGFAGGCTGGASGGAGLIFATSASPAAALTTAAQKLENLHNHRVLAPLSATLLVFPGIELQPAFHQQGPAPGAILVDHLGLTAKGRAVDEHHLFPVFTALGAELVVHREPEIDHRHLAGEV